MCSTLGSTLNPKRKRGLSSSFTLRAIVLRIAHVGMFELAGEYRGAEHAPLAMSWKQTLRAGGADGRAHVAKRRVGACAQRRDRYQANHDDQGQHDSVLNRRRAFFLLQKLYD